MIVRSSQTRGNGRIREAQCFRSSVPVYLAASTPLEGNVGFPGGSLLSNEPPLPIE